MTESWRDLFQNPVAFNPVRPAAAADFPTIDDFEVVAIPTEDFGTHVVFRSRTLGLIGTFPWWDHLEAATPPIPIRDPEKPDWVPFGTREEPFWDCEQGWKFQAWSDGEYVYAMQGEDCSASTYVTWYKVPEHRFRQAWREFVRRLP